MYTSDAEGSDVLLIGELTAGLKDGSTTVTDFVARVIIEGIAENKPRMKLYQVWIGSSTNSKSRPISQTGCKIRQTHSRVYRTSVLPL